MEEKDFQARLGELFNYVKGRLGALGFENDGDVYVLTRTAQKPGARIIVNGRVMQQQGTSIELKYAVEIMGDGYVDDDPTIILRLSIAHAERTILEESLWIAHSDYKEFEDVIQGFLKVFLSD